MVNIKKNSRVEYLDQVISIMGSAYGVQERAPGPGIKLQASSAKLFEHQAASNKRQASSHKRQAP